MTQPKIVSTTYRYQVDQQSIAQVQAANAKVIGSLQAVRTTADADYANLVQQYAAEAAAAEAAATRTAGAYTKVEAAAARAANAIHDIGVQSQRELPEPSLSSFGLDEAGSSTAGKLRQASQAAIALPGVGFQSPLVLGLRAASIAADKTGASFLELGIAGGALAIVGVAAAIAVKDFTKSIEDSKKVLTGALSAQDNYYTALATMTTEQVEAQVATLQRARPLLKQQIDETQNALDSAFAQAQAQFGDATARALDASGKLPTAQLREQLEGLNAQFEENVQSTTRFKQGLESNVFAVNGLSDALKKMHDEAVKTADRIIGATTAIDLNRADVRLSVDQMTQPERDARAAEIRREIQILQEEQRAVGEFSVTGALLRDRIDKLNLELGITVEATDTFADGLARVAAYDETFQNLGKAIEKEGEAAARTTDAINNLAEATQEHADKLAEINADAEDKATKDRAKAAKDEADARAKAAEKAEEESRKHLERIADIERQFAIDSETAVGNRDALALYQAQQKHTEDLTKEQESYAEQQQELQDNLDEQLKSIRDNLDEQLKSEQDAQRKAIESENRAWAKRQQQLIDALQKAQVEESRAHGLALGYQRQFDDNTLNEQIRAQNTAAYSQVSANQQAQNIESAHQVSLLTILASGAVAIESQWQQMLTNLYLMSGAAIGGNGGIGAPLGFSTPAVRRIVDQRVNQIFREAQR